MDGDEEVGLVAVGNFGTFVQLDEFVGTTCIDHLHIVVMLANQVTQFEGDS